VTARLPRLRYRPDRRYAQLRLPRMSPGEALFVSCALDQAEERLPACFPRMRRTDLDLLAAILVRVHRAVWRAYGNGMADHLGMLGVETPAPPGSISTFEPVETDEPF